MNVLTVMFACMDKSFTMITVIIVLSVCQGAVLKRNVLPFPHAIKYAIITVTVKTQDVVVNHNASIISYVREISYKVTIANKIKNA